MGILSGLLGHASEVDIADIEKDLEEVLIEKERVETAFRLIRDLFVFTNSRLILINRQGVTGKKTEFLSLPYVSISHFSVETAGHLDLESELHIWVKGHEQPFTKEFKKDSNIQKVQRTLASYVLAYS